MNIGDRVRPSEYAIRPKRDYYHNQGEYARKQTAKRAVEELEQQRGTITDVDATSYKVTWDNGSQSHCLKYRVSAA